MTIFSPIFVGGKLVGFGATKAHWLDIGSKDPGQSMDSTSIYQEGYRIGPVHLYKEGVPQDAILDFLTRNSRLPRSVWGDMHAQIAACRTGEIRLQALYEKFGEEVILEATERIWKQCEILDSQEVRKIPDGVYSAEGALDSDRPGGNPVPVKVKVTIKDDKMILDLRGSSPQTGGSVNCGVALQIDLSASATSPLCNGKDDKEKCSKSPFASQCCRNIYTG